MRKYHSPKEYLDAANSLATSPAELRRLANSPYPFVTYAVARNPNTEPDVLTSLLPPCIESDHDVYVAMALIENPTTLSTLVSILVERLFPIQTVQPRDGLKMRLLLLLCTEPKLPLNLVAQLIDPQIAPKHLRRQIAHDTRRREILDILMRDPSELVRKQARKTLDSIASA